MVLAMILYGAIILMGSLALYYIYRVDKQLEQHRKKPPDNLEDELGSEINQVMDWIETGRINERK